MSNNSTYTHDPDRCPVCKSEDFYLRHDDRDSAYVWLTWSCSTCQSEWVEEYRLHNMEVIDRCEVPPSPSHDEQNK